MQEQQAPIDPDNPSVLVRVWLLGSFEVQRRNEQGAWKTIERNKWERHYARSFLARLLCLPGRRGQRTSLIDDLWPDPSNPDAVERYLTDAAYVVRKNFLPHALLQTLNNNAGYTLVNQTLLWCDADACESLLQEAEQIGRTSTEALPLLEQAQRYFARGAFLESESGQWAHARRGTMERLSHRCSLWLAEAYEQQGRMGQAEMVYSRLLEEKPTDEDTLCRLLVVLQKQGMMSQVQQCYQQAKRHFQQEGLELSPTTSALVKGLLHEPKQVEYYFSHHTIISHPLEKEQQFEQQAQLLTASLGSLAPLLTNEWTTDTMIDVLQTILPVVQVLPASIQQRLLQASIPSKKRMASFIESKQVSEDGRAQLHRALSQSIATSWELFLSIGNPQMLILGQTQLTFVQQSNTFLYPSTRPFLYSGVYGLIGIALHFQERDEEALRVHQNGYMAALATNDSWYIAQSLICQADCYHALKQFDSAIYIIQEALNVIDIPINEAQTCAVSHLLTCWADSAMMLQDYKTAQEKLEAAEKYLTQIVLNTEFDRTSWRLLAGKYSLVTQKYASAIQHFEAALAELPEQWMLRRVMTAIGLTKAYAKIRERDSSLNIAKNLVPMLQTINASMTNRWFAEYLQNDLLDAFPTDALVHTFVTDTYLRLPQLARLGQ